MTASRRRSRSGARSTIMRPFKVEAVRQRVNAQIGRRAVLTIPVVLG